MVGRIEHPRYSYGLRIEALGFRMAELLENIGIRMVGLNVASRFSYVWTFRGPPVIVWLHS